MVLDWAAAGLLLGGAAPCATIAVGRPRQRLPAAGFAAALGCAGVREAAAADAGGAAIALSVAACACALAGAAALIARRLGRPDRLSWLDGVMGASAVGALVVTLGLDAAAVVAAAGAPAAPPLSRGGVAGGVVCGLARPPPPRG